MAKTSIKSIEKLVKTLPELTEENLTTIIDCENVDVTALSEREKLCVLVFAELAKALDSKDRKLVLDCNYAASKFHNHKDAAADQYLVDYFRLVPTANVNSTLIQFYVRANPAKNTVTFRLCTSCALANRDQFVALEDELHFKVQWDKEHTRAKTSQRNNVTYEELVDVVNSVCAVLASTRVEAEKAKAEKAKAAAEKKAAAKAEKAAKKKTTTKKKSSKKSAKTKTEEVPQTDDPLEDITE